MAAANSMAATIPPHLLRSTVELAMSTFAQNARSGLASASVINLVEGVLNMMSLRKMALVACGLTVIGAIVATGGVLAFQQPASAVGSAQRNVEAESRHEPATTVANPNRASKEVFTKTYYVGDILLAGQPVDKKRGIDMTPLIEFITATIAPGTWRIVDTSGKEITGPSDSKKTVAAGGSDKSETGQIIPFFLSISLIIRHDAGVHEQVANLLRGFRTVVFGRPEEVEDHPQPQTGVALPKLSDVPGQVERSPDPTGAVAPASAGADRVVRESSTAIGRPTKRPAATGSSERIKKLLKEIEQEVEQLAGKP
jgi:hypothetical protein